MRLSMGTAVMLLLIVGSCAKIEDVESARAYAAAVEWEVQSLESRLDRRIEDLEARMDDVEIYAAAACDRVRC